VKALGVVVAAGLGTLFAIGSLLAALFERAGFGSPRDSEPRVAYLGLLAIGFVASVATPIVLSWLVFPTVRSRSVAVAGGIVALAGFMFIVSCAR
jgi:hypothetical protein